MGNNRGDAMHEVSAIIINDTIINDINGLINNKK
jgi:hypothetical protein